MGWVAAGIIAAVAAVLGIKVWLLRHCARSLGLDLAQKLRDDTNTLLSLPCRDRELRRLASSLNEELRLLRKERLRYQQGDRELKGRNTRRHPAEQADSRNSPVEAVRRQSGNRSRGIPGFFCHGYCDRLGSWVPPDRRLPAGNRDFGRLFSLLLGGGGGLGGLCCHGRPAGPQPGDWAGHRCFSCLFPAVCGTIPRAGPRAAGADTGA